MGPLEASLPWNAKGLEGARKFLDRVWRFYYSEEYQSRFTDVNDGSLDKVYNQTVKKVTNDYDTLGFNTAIAQMMIFMNDVYKAEKVYKPYMEGFIKLLSPICPHIAEEIWADLGHDNTIAYESWPTYDESKLTSDSLNLVVQVNGKLRDKIEVAVDADNETIIATALASEKVKAFTDGHEVIKTIVVPKKLVNIVVR